MNDLILNRYASIMKPIYDRINNYHKRQLHEGQIKVIQALFNERKKIIFSQWGRSGGKLLTLDTLIPTPDRGFVPMSHIHVGDKVFGSDGKPCNVIFESRIEEKPILYRVKFNDGSYIDACKDHRWLTTTKQIRRSIKKNRGKMPNRSPLQTPKVYTTEEIKNSLKHGNEYNHAIPCCEPIDMPHAPLPIDPYLLGTWLGDGNSHCGSICKPEQEIFDEIEKRGYRVLNWQADNKSRSVEGLSNLLKQNNLLCNKHIPSIYLWASIEQRLSLLQGLMDTDGTIDKQGKCCFDNTNKNIADGVLHLLVSLGEKPCRGERVGKLYGKEKKLCYRIYFNPSIPAFRLSRKLARQKYNKRSNFRQIVAVEQIASRPGKCIQVDSIDHLYLASKSFIPTHNTEGNLFLACVYALLNDQTETYIICPELKQAKQIYWYPKRLQLYPPQEFVSECRESELRLLFHNKSSIVLNGAENYQALRGIKPNFVIYDEFQDHCKEFDEEVMQPTLIGRGVSLVITGTPPKTRDAYFVEFRERILEEIAGGDKTRAYFELPCWYNPVMEKEELDRKKASLFKSGDENIWYREYEGRLVFGGEGTVFPRWDRRKHVQNHTTLMAALQRDKQKLRWITAIDPGTTTCFAVLFGVHNPYTQQLFLLDEIYEKDRKLTDSRTMWERIKRKERELFPEAPPRFFRRVCDEAAAWFMQEVSSNYHEAIAPTHKAKRDIEDDISLIKLMMSEENCLFVSDKCQSLIWEIESYVTDENNKLPDENDHLVDCARYMLNHVGFKFVEKIAPEDVKVLEENRIINNPVQIVKPQTEDWTENVLDNFDTAYSDDYNSWN